MPSQLPRVSSVLAPCRCAGPAPEDVAVHEAGDRVRSTQQTKRPEMALAQSGKTVTSGGRHVCPWKPGSEGLPEVGAEAGCPG